MFENVSDVGTEIHRLSLRNVGRGQRKAKKYWERRVVCLTSLGGISGLCALISGICAVILLMGMWPILNPGLKEYF